MSRTATCLLPAIVLAACGHVASDPGDPAVDATRTADAAAAADGPLPTCGNARLDPGEDCDGGGDCPGDCRLPPPPGSVAVRFAATVTLVDDASGVFSGRLVAGTTRIWGRGVYPVDMTDSVADPDQGRYLYTNTASPDTIGLWMQVGDWRLHPATGNGEIDVTNGIGADDAFYLQMGNAAFEPTVAAFQSASLYLTDLERTAFIDDTLPATSLPPVTVWDSRRLLFQGDNPAGVHWFVEAAVDDLSFETP